MGISTALWASTFPLVIINSRIILLLKIGEIGSQELG